MEPKKLKYNRGKYGHWDFLESWGLFEDFMLGNVAKYIFRCRYKETFEQDLDKATDYLEHAVKKSKRHIYRYEGLPVDKTCADYSLNEREVKLLDIMLRFKEAGLTDRICLLNLFKSEVDKYKKSYTLNIDKAK